MAGQHAVIAQHGFSDGQLGYVLIDLADGKMREHWQADEVFLPGSVLKLATSLVAWRTLGPNFRFTTTLWRKDAALYLQGSGDPVLAATDLRDLARQLHALQPPATWQSFYVDASAVTPGLEISPQQPLAADYNPGYGALNVDFNRLALDWQVVSGSASYRLSSQADGFSVPVDWISLTRGPTDLPTGMPFLLAAPGSAVEPESWAYAADLSRAGLANSGGYFLPVKNADPMTARLFRAIAQQQGVNLPLPQPGVVPADAVMIARHESPALSEMLAALLRYSNNLSAEMIGLAVDRKLGGAAATLSAATAREMAWLQQALPQTDWQGFRMVNHSGLDGENRATPRQITAVLQAIATDPALAACLPALTVSDAEDATFANTPRVTGKSGTMDYAAGLAGLITAPNGHRFAFAVFIVDAAARARLAAAFDPRILHAASDGRAWTKRARELEADLLQHWLRVSGSPP